MEIRLNKKLLLLIIIHAIIIPVLGQIRNNYNIEEVSVNNVKIVSSIEDYRSFFDGNTVSDSIVWNDYDEENMRVVIFRGDSLYIYMSSYNPSNLYTKYIEIFSPYYKVKLHNMEFYVGMGIDDLKILIPDISEKYKLYIGKDGERLEIPAYFGEQMMISTNNTNTPSYPCQGLKFQIKGERVISIMIDLRTDGDF
jgi:hypothetical protein